MALGDAFPVRAVLFRLMEEGLDRHDAVHAIGSVLAEQLSAGLDEEGGSGTLNADYLEKLKHLTADSWRKQAARSPPWKTFYINSLLLYEFPCEKAQIMYQPQNRQASRIAQQAKGAAKMAKAKTDALQLKWGCSRETAIYIRALENRVRHLHGACEDLGNAASEKGLCTRIWINPHTKLLSERHVFRLRRPPKQQILARMADKQGASLWKWRSEGGMMERLPQRFCPPWRGAWMPENISGIPAGRSVFRLTSPLIGHSHSDGDCGCQIGQNC